MRIARPFVGMAILFLPFASFAASPDDYAFPIGRIDTQILCEAGQRRSSETRRKELECLAGFSGVVTRSGDDLRFKLDNGQTKIVKSNSRACKQIPIGDCIIYELVGYIAASKQFVLQVSFYESVFVHLLSRRTGTVTKLEGYPRLSPSGKEFVTVAASDAWAIDNPIAVYLNTDPPNLEWRFPQPH